MTDDNQILSHPARVHLMAESRAALVQQARLVLGDELPDEDIFVFRAEISNDLLDSHFTHMDESTLRNYNDDATLGVAFLRGHNWKELPIGYSMNSLLEDTAGRKRVVTDFYTVRGLPDTNDLIHRLKTRLVRDVSVGFGGGTMRCDICTNDFWECRHWPGMKYEVKDGDVIRDVVATFTIEDAHLSEVSGVFDGSTPQAMVLKAERFAAAGLLTQDEAYKLERQYRVNLPLTRSFGGVDPKSKEKKMEEETEVRTLDGKQLQKVVDALALRGILPEEQRKTVKPDEIVTYVRLACERIKTLEPLAEDGRNYRTQLVADALAQGVRCQGEKFNQDSYRAILETAPLTTVRQMHDDWKEIADKVLPAGRRTANDEDRQQGKVKTDAHIKDESYA